MPPTSECRQPIQDSKQEPSPGEPAGAPRLWPFLGGLAAVGFAVLCAVLLRNEAWGTGGVLFLAAIGMWFQALGWRAPTPQGRSHLEAILGAHPLVGGRTLQTRRLWLGGLVWAGAIGLSVWTVLRLDVAQTTQQDWLWYAAGIGLLVLGAVSVEPWARPSVAAQSIGRRPTGSEDIRAQRTPAGWILLCLIGIGLLLRVLWLETLPFGTWYDEAANGLEALRVVREPAYRPIYTDGVNATGHYLFLIASFFQLFGTGATALRLISALMGTATVAAAYFAGRELHGRALGVTLAGLYVAARWSLTFSRLGMYNAAAPLFELLTLGFLLRGLRRGSILDFTLAGLSIGLGLSFYSAFQLFLPVLTLGLLLVAWQERRQWRRLWAGVAITVVAALVVVAPLVKYVMVEPDRYFARVQTTSLFRDKAETERLSALWENTRKHLLMFHVRGDPNGRHNVPGEPMIDPITGGLMLVGLALCLRFIYRPAYMLAPVWLVFGLFGGILSLDFEAPQSLRAISAQPAALLCAAWPAVVLHRSWSRGAGRYFPQVGLAVIVAVLVVPAGWLNARTYFGDQAHNFASWNAHSTPETITAHMLASLPDDTTAYVIALFDAHPTVRFLAGDAEYRRLETNATLPLLHAIEQDARLILDVERRGLFREAKRLYPNAHFEEVRPPFSGPPTLLTVDLRRQDIESIQGLTATYTHGTDSAGQAEQEDSQRGEAEGSADISAAADATAATAGTMQQTRQERAVDHIWPEAAPVPLPFDVVWEGVLAVNRYGPHQFFVEAPGNVLLEIGASTVISGNTNSQAEPSTEADLSASVAGGLAGGVVLARGHHPIRLVAEGSEGVMRLSWQPPESPPAVVPPWALYAPPVRSQGLLGRYYANGDWAGEPALAQIDPKLDVYFHVPVLSRPYTVEWTGKLAAPETGNYRFGLQSIDESILYIDGEEVAVVQERNQLASQTVHLEAGLHDIRVRYGDRTDHTYIRLLWQPPSRAGTGGLQAVPPDFLFPPRDDYAGVDVAELGRFLEAGDALETGIEPLPEDSRIEELAVNVEVEVVLDGLIGARGVTVFDGRVYVADSEEATIHIWDTKDEQAIRLETGPESAVHAQDLLEPIDLAATADEQVWVLDAGLGQVLRYDPASRELSALDIPKEIVRRARGLDVTQDGTVWIASTPGQRVVAVAPGGRVMRDFALPNIGNDGQPMQPVDALALEDGTLMATDAVNHRLYHFSASGAVITSRPIPVANTLDGSHLARGTQGEIYMTQPEEGRVVQIDENGRLVGAITVRTPGNPAVAPDAKPVGLAVDDAGVIWVADSQGGQLLRVTRVD